MEDETPAPEEQQQPPPAPPNLDMFNFDDEKPKKRRKPKKKKNKKKQVQTREYYENKLTNLNTRLANLRSQFAKKNETNQKLADELITIEEDHEDVCEFLQRTIKDRKTSIVELHTTLKKLESQRDEYKIWSQQRILDLQKQFAVDRSQLQSEIVLQKKTLNSLDEYRIKRDAALSHFEIHNEGIAELEHQIKEDAYDMAQKAAVQKNILKKEVEYKLRHLAEDFLHSYEIRNAGYTRNLIRENIILTKRMDKLVSQNVRTMEEREKQYLKTKEIMESYTALEQLSEQLRRTIENKNDIINQLTARIDRMRTKYIDARRFQRLHDIAKTRRLFDKRGPKNLVEVQRFLERLNNDKNAIIQQQRLQAQEIQRMRKILDTLQIAVEKTILALQQLGPGESMEPTDRRAMINELIYLAISDLINDECKRGAVELSDIYLLGKCGLIPPPLRYDMPLNLIFARANTKPELCAKSDATKSRSFDISTCKALSTIEECSLEDETSCSEKAGDVQENVHIENTAKDILEREWLKVDLLADSIRTAHQFQRCFDNMSSCMLMDCNSDFSPSSVDRMNTQETQEKKSDEIDKASYDSWY